MDTYENQNNRQAAELANKVSRLKHIAYDIENETKEHNSFLQSMTFDFDTARSFLGGSARHLTRVMKSGRGNRGVMCYLIGAMLLAFFFIYFVVKTFRDQ